MYPLKIVSLLVRLFVSHFIFAKYSIMIFIVNQIIHRVQEAVFPFFGSCLKQKDRHVLHVPQ